ncbi:MAG: hypothetical protein WCC60_14280 [Ilumatobacteraceae bacterium]
MPDTEVPFWAMYTDAADRVVQTVWNSTLTTGPPPTTHQPDWYPWFDRFTETVTTHANACTALIPVAEIRDTDVRETVAAATDQWRTTTNSAAAHHV